MDYSLTNELLEKDTTHTFGNQDWVQFVIDHVRILLSNSDEEIINPNDMFKYRYRPKSLFDKFTTDVQDLCRSQELCGLLCESLLPNDLITGPVSLPHRARSHRVYHPYCHLRQNIGHNIPWVEVY